MKINAIREYYRENQCNTFCSNFPCIFTLVILMPFIVNIISFQITIYGIPVLWYFFYGYLSLIFQRPKNVQVTFLVCPSNVVYFWWVMIVTEFNIVTTRSPLPLDNRELASSYRQFQCVHYLYREYQCIVLYLFHRQY